MVPRVATDMRHDHTWNPGGSPAGLLMRSTQRSYGKGQVLFHAQDRAERVWLLQKGRVHMNGYSCIRVFPDLKKDRIPEVGRARITLSDLPGLRTLVKKEQVSSHPHHPLE